MTDTLTETPIDTSIEALEAAEAAYAKAKVAERAAELAKFDATDAHSEAERYAFDCKRDLHAIQSARVEERK